MSPRSKEQNAAIKDERREQLLLAALKVFAHKGFAATKIGDIAASAGMSHGLVYHYFKAKEDIFIELTRRATTGAILHLQQVDKLELSPTDKLRAIARSTLEVFDMSEESVYSYYLMVQATASDTGIAEVNDILQNFTVPMEITARAIAQGQADGTLIEGNPAEYALMFWAAVQGLAVCKVAGGASLRMPDGALLVRMLEKHG